MIANIILITAVLVCGIGWYRSKRKIATLRAMVARMDASISDYIKANETLVREKDTCVAKVKDFEKRYSEKEQQCNVLIKKLEEMSKDKETHYGH